jgi:predicted permease
MLTTFGALAPVFLLIALGWLLRVRGFPGDPFWPGAERLVYWILFPALLLATTASSDLTGVRTLPVAVALVAAIVATSALAFALRGRLGLDGASFTSVFQGAIRSNTYVGLAGAGALYGEALECSSNSAAMKRTDGYEFNGLASSVRKDTKGYDRYAIG